jgi:glyoxylase-like metal-dependent hydrolase (beta-lactamase superfamily II)
VVLSHLHFDHTGDCTKFPDAELIVGPGSRAATTPGWPEARGSPFDGSILKHQHFRELDFDKDEWRPLGPFARAVDYFGDGSFFIIDAPGHMDGHLGALAKTGEDEWIFMGGDCCHHRSLLAGIRPMSVTVGPSKTPSFHRYPDVAKSTIHKVRLLEKQGSVLVALAHDARLDGVMPLYPGSLNGWKDSDWKKTLDQGLARDYPDEYPPQQL